MTPQRSADIRIVRPEIVCWLFGRLRLPIYDRENASCKIVLEFHSRLKELHPGRGLVGSQKDQAALLDVISALGLAMRQALCSGDRLRSRAVSWE